MQKSNSKPNFLSKTFCSPPTALFHAGNYPFRANPLSITHETWIIAGNKKTRSATLRVFVLFQ